MSEKQATAEVVVTNYHEAEQRSLDELVTKGSLREEVALNGKMYVLPLETGDYPIAISTGKLVVRSGDEVKLERSTPGGPVTAITEIGGFHIDSGNGEIQGHTRAATPSILRVNDITENRSAAVRALAPTLPRK